MNKKGQKRMNISMGGVQLRATLRRMGRIDRGPAVFERRNNSERFLGHHVIRYIVHRKIKVD